MYAMTDRLSAVLSHRLIVAAFSVATAIVLIMSVLPSGDYYAVDFKYFWLSGKLWSGGISPYGPELQMLGEQSFPDYRVNPFFYPPNWVVISTLVALFDADTAAALWASVSAGALVFASWQIAGLTGTDQASSSRTYRFLFILFALVVVAHSGSVAIHIGQPTPILLCALTSLLVAIQGQDRRLATVAMILLLLKPQFSLPVLLTAFLYLPWIRKSTMLAGGVTMFLIAIGLGWSDPIQIVNQFLSNIGQYGTYPENWPIHMSGLSFLVAFVGGAAISAFVWLTVAVLTVILAGTIAQRRGADFSAPKDSTLLLVSVTVWTLCVLPTHNGDLLLVAPSILLWSRMRPASRWVYALGSILIMRSLSFSVPLNALAFDEKTVWVGLLDTLGLLAISLAVAQALIRPYGHKGDTVFRACSTHLRQR